MNTAMKLRLEQRAGTFLTRWENISFSRTVPRAVLQVCSTLNTSITWSTTYKHGPIFATRTHYIFWSRRLSLETPCALPSSFILCSLPRSPPNPLGTAYLISWLPVIRNHLSVDFRHVVTDAVQARGHRARPGLGIVPTSGHEPF